MEVKRILILDDEQEICFLLATLLDQMGYHTDCAHNLDDGKRKLTTGNSFDLIFLDLNLPDGLGHNLIPTIREQHRDAKVVMISAHGALLKQIQNSTYGVDHFITKPFDRQNITNVLTELDL